MAPAAGSSPRKISRYAPGPRQQVRADQPGQLARRGVRRGLQRIGGADHVAVDVAAGAECVQTARDDCPHVFLQMALADAVELKRLARRQAQRAVGGVVGEVVQRQPLPRQAPPARHPYPYHELVARFEFCASPIVAQIPVVLLVDAEKFRQLRIRIPDRSGQWVRQTLFDRASQEMAVEFQTLVWMQLVDRARQIGGALLFAHQ